LGDEFYQDKNSNELPELKSNLESILNELNLLPDEKKKNLKGAGWNRYLENDKFIGDKNSNYEDITNEIKDVINWLDVLIKNDCGFRAWF